MVEQLVAWSAHEKVSYSVDVWVDVKAAEWVDD